MSVDAHPVNQAWGLTKAITGIVDGSTRGPGKAVETKRLITVWKKHPLSACSLPSAAGWKGHSPPSCSRSSSLVPTISFFHNALHRKPLKAVGVHSLRNIFQVDSVRSRGSFVAEDGCIGECFQNPHCHQRDIRGGGG